MYNNVKLCDTKAHLPDSNKELIHIQKKNQKSSSETTAMWRTVEINLSLCLSSKIHPDARNKHLDELP